MKRAVKRVEKTSRQLAVLESVAVQGSCCSGMEMTEGRKAVGVDGDAKRRNLLRLKRVEGQVRGVHKMIEEDRYCADILSQLAAVQEALRSVGRELMRNHLRHCATSAFAEGSERREEMCDELLELMYTNAR